MSIYTRRGDEGFTDLGDGQRVRKDDERVAALGELDELNAALGWAMHVAQRVERDVVITSMLEPVAAELFCLGVWLSGQVPQELPPPAAAVGRMEEDIDQIAATLPPLASFVLPGGSELACRLHIARAICRRAERAVVAFVSHADAGGIQADAQRLARQYLNRLSDLLFTLARLANHADGSGDRLWAPGRR